jgi:Lrp/AsnC family leucine-responsive transcriptional regulator
MLDAVDWQILAELQENARISFAELGRRVGLSAPAVAERVSRMEEAGIITGYRAQVNLKALGWSILAFTRFTSRDSNRYHEVARMAQDIPEILECHRVTGSECLYLKVAVSSIQHLEVLIDLLEKYGQTETTIVLSSTVTERCISAPPGVGM